MIQQGAIPSGGNKDRKSNAGPDPYTLWVLTVMATLTISTPAVQIAGIPRITLISVPFTIYMILQLRGRVSSDLVRFSAAYLLAFIPSTIWALYTQSLDISSILQAFAGLITMVAAGSYFKKWLLTSRRQRLAQDFINVSALLISLALIETIFPDIFRSIRQWLYPYTSGAIDIQTLIDRETALYGVRPAGFFSEPSHLARYVGILMTGYVFATKRAKASLCAFGAALLTTRSVSFFFALPAMLAELLRPAVDEKKHVRNAQQLPVSGQSIRIAAIATLTALGIFYTQGERIGALVDGQYAAVSGVTSDTSLNERILIPARYFFEERESVALGLGPTPQDELQSYTLYSSRALYGWKINSDYKSAISASFMTIAGMGYIGVVVLLIMSYILIGRAGIIMVASFFLANAISSGYHSTTSLLPSGLLLGLLSAQRQLKPRLT